MPTSLTGIRFDEYLVGHFDKLDKNIDALMEDVSIKGQETLYEMIETRGAARMGGKARWKKPDRYGRWASDPGRVAGGDMRAAIERNHGTRGKTTAFASFGWLNHYEKYYGLQEEGFDHPITGEHVPGMFMFADAKDIMWKYAEDRLDVILRAF